jgi:hypothetical protein
MSRWYMIIVIHINSRLILLLFCLFASPFFCYGQERKLKIDAQFNYNQIDSLINATVANLGKDSSSFVVANVMWYVGSYDEGNPVYVAHRNHFDIYIIFSKNGKMYVQKIDNYGFFKRRRIKGNEVWYFLMHSFGTMQKEVLSRKVDTTYVQGKVHTSTTIVDHQLVRTVKIINSYDTLQYDYPTDYSANPKNFETDRYKFLICIDKVINRFDKRKRKRQGIVFGYDSEIR